MMAALERSISRVSFFISWAPAYFDIMFALSVAHDEDCWRHYFCNYVADEDQMREKQIAGKHTINDKLSTSLVSRALKRCAISSENGHCLVIQQKCLLKTGGKVVQLRHTFPDLVIAFAANLPSQVMVFL